MLEFFMGVESQYFSYLFLSQFLPLPFFSHLPQIKNRGAPGQGKKMAENHAAEACLRALGIVASSNTPAREYVPSLMDFQQSKSGPASGAASQNTGQPADYRPTYKSE